jgi:hypothetical protein
MAMLPKAIKSKSHQNSNVILQERKINPKIHMEA